MKSLFIAGILLGLFAWIHAKKVDMGISTDNMGREEIADTIPLSKSTQMKKRTDTAFNKKLEFRDTSNTKKARDSFYHRKMLDTPLAK